jgi:hypothetical protein
MLGGGNVGAFGNKPVDATAALNARWSRSEALRRLIERGLK